MRFSPLLGALGATVIATVVVSCTPIAQAQKPESVEAVVYSMDEMLQIRDELLEELADLRGLDNPPDVDLIRFIPLSEFGPTRVDCLAEQGFDVRLTPDKEGIDYSEVSPDLSESLNLADYICSAQYPVDPRYEAPLTQSQLELLYFYYTVELIPCLKVAGFEIGEPPSFAVFAQDYPTERGWAPYAELPIEGMSNEEFFALEERCPQNPPGAELYPIP